MDYNWLISAVLIVLGLVCLAAGKVRKSQGFLGAGIFLLVVGIIQIFYPLID